MNTASTEIGWIITNPDCDSYVGELFDNMPEDDNGHNIPGTENHPETYDPAPLYVETDPEDLTRVFVSLSDVRHGMDLGYLVPNLNLGKIVRQFLESHDPNIRIIFGIIETTR